MQHYNRGENVTHRQCCIDGEVTMRLKWFGDAIAGWRRWHSGSGEAEMGRWDGNHVADMARQRSGEGGVIKLERCMENDKSRAGHHRFPEKGIRHQMRNLSSMSTTLQQFIAHLTCTAERGWRILLDRSCPYPSASCVNNGFILSSSCSRSVSRATEPEMRFRSTAPSHSQAPRSQA
jgi:hypothetical protein